MLPHSVSKFIHCWDQESEKENLKMLITKKMLLALTIVGALLGAGIGALITHTGSGSTSASTTPSTTNDASKYSVNQTDPNYKTPEQLAADNAAKFKTPEEQTAFREGFSDGYTSCSSAQTGTSSQNYSASSPYRAPVRRYSNGRRVYYDYGNSHGRTFWQKHRDKLTVAMGTGAGALIGGLIGGKRGAGIGMLAGGGGSALYTYKLRHRSRRY
jgi:uncharacterized protein YcfJ